MRNEVEVADFREILSELPEALVRRYLFEVRLRQSLGISEVGCVWAFKENLAVVFHTFGINERPVPPFRFATY